MANITYDDIDGFSPQELLGMLVTGKMPNGTTVGLGAQIPESIAPIGQDKAKPAKVTAVSTTAGSPTVLPVPTTPAGFAPSYVIVYNTHETAVLLAEPNQNPAFASGDPPTASQYGKGLMIPPGQAAPIGLTGTITDLRLVSDTPATTAWVCWCARP